MKIPLQGITIQYPFMHEYPLKNVPRRKDEIKELVQKYPHSPWMPFLWYIPVPVFNI